MRNKPALTRDVGYTRNCHSNLLFRRSAVRKSVVVPIHPAVGGCLGALRACTDFAAQKEMSMALVQRDDAVQATMLRKLATHSRDGDVWVGSRTCVSNGEMVTVLQQEAEFAWILTAGGVEGFLKLKYLPQFEAQYTAKVQRHGNGGSTRLRKVATHSRDGDVWVAGGTCVLNDEVVTVLRREADFAWIRTAGGVEGYLKLSYLQGVGGAPTKKMRMFHGTDGANAASIIQHGLRASTGGRLGPGVYLTPNQAVANAVARHRGLQFVVECEVTPGKVYNFDAGTGALLAGKTSWHQNGFDAAQSVHPPWAGVAEPFCEYCVHDVAAVRVIKVDGFVAKPM